MRILVLSNLYPPDFTGGYELICRQVADCLAQRGQDVCVLTSIPRSPVAAEPNVHRLLHYVNTFDTTWTMKLGPRGRLLGEVRSNLICAANVHALVTVLEAFAPDVVYLHNLLGLGGLGLLGCLRHLRVPWVWQLGDAVPRQLCSLGRQAVPHLVREYNRQVRGRYLACSRRLVEEIEAGGLDLAGQVELLPNWVEGLPPAARARYLDGGRLRIVAAGQVNRDKGIDILIESAARLRQAGHDNFTIDVYGRLWDQTFQALIDKLRVQDQVTLKGVVSQDELARRFSAYDVFAFPTWPREPFGCAALEAAARGCVPMISEDCGIGEWLVHGVHCLKVERSAAAFTGVFEDILQGRTDLEPLGRRAAVVVNRDFHLGALVLRIEQTLARAARQPRTGAGSAREAFQLALLAERNAEVLVHESCAA